MHGALLIKAWNAFVRNQSVKQLRFNAKESWPRLVGKPKPVL